MFGRVEAFSIGELLNDKMALIHIEKANPDIRGLYQAINNEFIRHEFSEVEFINREEDMGLAWSSSSKESYNPDHFAEKYDAVYANEADNATGGISQSRAMKPVVAVAQIPILISYFDASTVVTKTFCDEVSSTNIFFAIVNYCFAKFMTRKLILCCNRESGRFLQY